MSTRYRRCTLFYFIKPNKKIKSAKLLKAVIETKEGLKVIDKDDIGLSDGDDTTVYSSSCDKNDTGLSEGEHKKY
jgi:hypothetical protein